MSLRFREEWPKTADMKAIDYWCSGCYVIVFAALTEYCIVLYLSRDKSPADDRQSKTRKAPGQSKRRRLLMATNVEQVARIFMPFALAVFCAVFWASV